MTLPESLRSLTKVRDELTAELTAEIWRLGSSCPHDQHVVLESAYDGTRSLDHDDARSETRLCLICGMSESGPEFCLMTRPFKRFEFGGTNFAKRLNETPLGERLMKTPLAEVSAWVSENGHPIWDEAMPARDIPSATSVAEDHPQTTRVVEPSTLPKVENCDTLRRLSQQLVDQLDRVHADGQYQSVWQMSWVHGVNYVGPTYSLELILLRNFLTAIREQRDERCGENLERATTGHERALFEGKI